MENYPKFHNEVGVPIVRIGCREFKCIGDKPPQDHPHIYLKIGDAGEIVCPYCSTLFRFDPSLGANEADPADCAYGERGTRLRLNAQHARAVDLSRSSSESSLAEKSIPRRVRNAAVKDE
jgi:uncharacterized Zn-finger protein